MGTMVPLSTLEYIHIQRTFRTHLQNKVKAVTIVIICESAESTK